MNIYNMGIADYQKEQEAAQTPRYTEVMKYEDGQPFVDDRQKHASHNPIMRLILTILFLLSSNLYGQYVSVYCGGMLPVRRSFIGVEVGKRIEPISVGLSGEISPTESNVSPKLNLYLKDIRLEGGIGWGHRWQKEGCNDHNYHTYTLGVFFERKRLFFGTNMFWRSYQAHIGLHRGSLRAIVGYRF